MTVIIVLSNDSMLTVYCNFLIRRNAWLMLLITLYDYTWNICRKNYRDSASEYICHLIAIDSHKFRLPVSYIYEIPNHLSFVF